MQNLSYNRKYMNKTKAIVKFCVIGILILLGLVLCFAKFTIPFTDTDYVGCFNAIKDKMGIDLNGGILAVYDVTASDSSTDLDTKVDATVKRIENMLSAKNYLEATVTKQRNGLDYKIRIEVPGMDNAEDIVEAIGTPANIEFMEPTESRITSDSGYNADKIFMSGHDIKKVDTVADSQGYWNIRLYFTDEGTAKFTEKVRNAGGYYLSIFSNGKLVSSPEITRENATTLGADGTVLITGQYDKAGAEAFALQIESGLYSVTLTESELSRIPATLGENAIKAGVIALIIGLVLIFVIMFLVYKDFGLLANLSLLVYTIIFLFCLAMIDAIQLTLPGIAGIILSIGMAVDANILIFEQVKEEYRTGKRFAAAVHSGFNKSVMTILDANVTTIIVSAILYFLSDGAIKGFAITLGLGVAISMFTGLVITRSFAKLYLYINPDNAARANIKGNNDSEQAGPEQPKKIEKRKLNMGGVKWSGWINWKILILILL